MTFRLVNELNHIDECLGVKIKFSERFGFEFVRINAAVFCGFSAVAGKLVYPPAKVSDEVSVQKT